MSKCTYINTYYSAAHQTFRLEKVSHDVNETEHDSPKEVTIRR